MIKVHCTAPFRLIQAAAPYMRDAGKKEMSSSPDGSPGYRTIINISSTTGRWSVTGY
jgi:3-oxoacyl-[acyl-carrier protein] reductase